MRIEIPRLALVVLVGAAGSGKSTFARSRFRATEVLSSDAFRAMIADREDDQSATDDAFRALHLVAGLRLARRRLTVVDAVSAKPGHRRPLLDLAAVHDAAAVAIVLDLPADLCVERDRARPGRTVGPAAVLAQHAAIARSLPGLADEGFAAVHVLGSPVEVDAAAVRRVPLAVDRRWDQGPFDVVGEVRGRLEALLTLLERLGYRPDPASGAPVHPEGRRAVFVGDLEDAGDGPDGVLRLVMAMGAADSGLAVRGDGELALTAVRTLGDDAERFLDALPSHLMLARGALAVTHAGIAADMLGRDSPRIDRFCLAPEPGWALGLRGRTLVVHGHDPVTSPRWLGRTLDLDTAGELTALRFPERELVSVPAVTPRC